jgi:hypothetical protein
MKAEDAEDQLDWTLPFFADPENAQARAALQIQGVSEDAPRAVVHDARVCGRLYALILQTRRTGSDGTEPHHGFDYVVLRYGPYYAVVMAEPSPGSEFSDMYIFRVSDFSYVGTVLV